jgi:tRNA threonylcarbamoyladenosine biosynthesis protein TsaE
MSEFTITYSSETILPLIARQVISFAKDEHRKVWLLEGEMGSGKTTLIKSVCKVLGVQQTVQSPTYGLVNEYTYPAGKVYHFDFYRLKHESEALDIGFEEYISSNEFCFIEWPSKIPSFLPSKYLKISITFVGQNQRNIHLSTHEQHS